MSEFVQFTQEQIDEHDSYLHYNAEHRPTIYCEFVSIRLSKEISCAYDFDSNTDMYQCFSIAEHPSLQKVIFIPQFTYKNKYVEIVTKPIDWENVSQGRDVNDFCFTMTRNTMKLALESIPK